MVFLHECYKLNYLNYICYSMKFHGFYAVSYKWYACIINMGRAFHTNRKLVSLISDARSINIGRFNSKYNYNTSIKIFNRYIHYINI